MTGWVVVGLNWQLPHYPKQVPRLAHMAEKMIKKAPLPWQETPLSTTWEKTSWKSVVGSSFIVFAKTGPTGMGTARADTGLLADWLMPSRCLQYDNIQSGFDVRYWFQHALDAEVEPNPVSWLLHTSLHICILEIGAPTPVNRCWKKKKLFFNFCIYTYL